MAVVEHRTGDRKVSGSRIGGRVFFSNVKSCSDSISVFVPPPCCGSRHLKDPGHSARGAGGRLQLNTYAPSVCGFA